MTIQEERLLLETKLQSTPGLKEQAEVILEILKHYSSIYDGHEDVYVERLLQLSATLKQRVYEGWVHFYRAHISWASGNYQKAIQENQKATTLFLKLKHQKGLAYAYNLSGKINFRLGKYADALERHFAALEIASFTGDKFVMAKALTGIGMVNMHQLQFAEAVSHLKHSLRLREEIDDRRGIADSCSYIGMAYLNQNNDAEALLQHFKALSIREEIGDKEGLANSYESIGMVYRRQANYTEALNNFFACLKIREETRATGKQMEDKPGIAAVQNMIGVIYTLKGNYTEALLHLQVSLQLNKEIGFKEGVARALHNLGRIYYEQGNYQEALSNSLMGLKMLEEIKSRLGICGSMIFLGKIFTSLKEYDKAAGYLEQGLRIAEEIGSKSQRKEALESWYELKKAEGDSASALSFHEQFREAEKELINEESIKKITGLQFSYQIDKKEQEIAFERQKQEVLQQANELLAEQKKEAEFQQHRAESSERSKQMFLANMSHEIRTPMNAIMGLTNLLLTTPQNRKSKEYLQAIKHSSDSLLVVINDILDLSKIEAGKMVLDQTPFSLKNQVKMLEQMFELRAREKQVQLKVNCDPGIPDVLTGDPNRLNQVLINLLGNAFKFTHKGNVCLVVKPEGKNKYRFSVVDTGIGIEKAKLKLIFENFNQADTSTTRKYGGTGLGLTISKQLVELMGGSIRVKSKPGNGSEFYFVITLMPGGKATGTEVAGNKPNKPAKDLAGIKILLAEDNEYNQIVAVEMLKKLVHKPLITIANTGKEVLQKLKKSNYDIILMDIHMPVMDGYEATRNIRENFTGKKKTIPIVALTASVLKADLDSCIASGMNGYVNKPFLPAELLREIYKHYGNKKEKQQEPIQAKPTVQQQKNGKAIDTAYLETLTEGKAADKLEYIDIFLKFAPAQIQKMEEAVKASDKHALYKALHTIKPQLKIMGAQKALLQTEELETKVRGADKINARIEDSAKIICTDIKAAMRYWNKIKETLN